MPVCRAVNSTSNTRSSPAASAAMWWETGRLSPLPSGSSVNNTFSAAPLPLLDNFNLKTAFFP